MNTIPKKALITGITGQDGSYLAEFLLQLFLHYGDQRDLASQVTAMLDETATIMEYPGEGPSRRKGRR